MIHDLTKTATSYRENLSLFLIFVTYNGVCLICSACLKGKPGIFFLSTLSWSPLFLFLGKRTLNSFFNPIYTDCSFCHEKDGITYMYEELRNQVTNTVPRLCSPGIHKLIVIYSPFFQNPLFLLLVPFLVFSFFVAAFFSVSRSNHFDS